MSRYPAAVWKPVTRYQPGGSSATAMTAHRRFMLHTAVSNADSLHPLMNTPGNAVSHFYVRQDGTVEQYVDTGIRSSAALDGNPDSITVETWDGFGASWNGGSPGPRWTDAQVEALAALAVWAHRTHGIPLDRCPSSKPGTRGVAWHRQGCDGNYEDPPGGLLGGRVNGGEHWSTSAGKVCPTTTRIRQVVDEVIPRARQIQTGDDMPTIHELMSHEINEDKQTVGDALRAALGSADRERRIIAGIGEVRAELKAAAAEDTADAARIRARIGAAADRLADLIKPDADPA